MGDKNPKKGKKPKKDRIIPTTAGIEERPEPELISRKKKPL